MNGSSMPLSGLEACEVPLSAYPEWHDKKYKLVYLLCPETSTVLWVNGKKITPREVWYRKGSNKGWDIVMGGQDPVGGSAVGLFIPLTEKEDK